MSMKNTFLMEFSYYKNMSETERLEAEFAILVDTCSLSGLEEVSKLWDEYLVERNKFAEQRKELVKDFLEKARKIYPYKLTLLDQHKIAVAQGNLRAIEKEEGGKE